MIETLLNTLEAERYVRGPLLLTVADELDAAGLEAAAQVAKLLLERVEKKGISDVEFECEVRTLRLVVRSLSSTRRSAAA